MSTKYPVTFSVDFPKRKLDRTSTFFRLFLAIPILILLGSVSASTMASGNESNAATVGAGGLLFLGPFLMILFRQKYPRWWFDWNLELLRFSSRVGVYLALMDDRYPSADEYQSVHLDITYPDVKNDLNQWMPLIKWFLAIPHFFVLIFLDIAAFFLVFFAWLNILFTGVYPKSIFDFLVGVFRWNLRVTGYAFILTTDEYPPFSLK